MKKIILMITAFVLLCGCAEQESTEINTEEISSMELTSETTEEITVTFAETEQTVTETTVPETEPTEITTVLNENQIEYRGRKAAVLMEFTGAEPLQYYPKALGKHDHRDDDYVLHSVVTVENLSKKSFDFIPQKILIRGRNEKRRYDMMPVTENDTGLELSDKYYTVEPGKSVSFRVDFIGDKECVEYADEIVYGYEVNYGENNIDYRELNNVAAGNFEMNKRLEVKKAVSKALELTESKALPFRFVMTDGDYQVSTDKNSFCFTVERVRPEEYVRDYIRVNFKVACLTGEAEVFEPNGFHLIHSDGSEEHPSYWNFDEAYARDPKVIDEVTVEGEAVKLYEYPFDLYIGSDGTAEYNLYFSCDRDYEYIGFEYEGKNDRFIKFTKEKDTDEN